MTALIAFDHATAPAPRDPRADLAGWERAALDWFRTIAIRARAEPRMPDPLNCALVGDTPEAQARAFLRMMPAALGRRVTLHRPAAESLSFDEAWLLGLLRAAARGEEHNLVFALASRLDRAFMRPARFLAEGLARHLAVIHTP